MNKIFIVVVFWLTTILNSNIVYAQGQSVTSDQVLQRVTSKFVCPLYMDKQPSSLTICEGASVVFDVEVSNTSGIAEKYEWQESLDGKLWSDISVNGLSNQLKLMNVSFLDNQKNFRVLVSVKVGEEACQLISNQVNLQVKEEPSVSIVQDGQRCSPVKGFVLSAKVESDSELNTISWSTAGKGSFSSLVGASTTYIFNEAEIGKPVLIFANHQTKASSCKAKEVSAKIFINDIDCGTFPWSGTN